MRVGDIVYVEADVFIAEIVRGGRALVHRKRDHTDMRVIDLKDYEIKLSELNKPYWRPKQ